MVVKASSGSWAEINEVMSHDATAAPDSCVAQQHQPATAKILQYYYPRNLCPALMMEQTESRSKLS